MKGPHAAARGGASGLSQPGAVGGGPSTPELPQGQRVELVHCEPREEECETATLLPVVDRLTLSEEKDKLAAKSCPTATSAEQEIEPPALLPPGPRKEDLFHLQSTTEPEECLGALCDTPRRALVAAEPQKESACMLSSAPECKRG